MKTINLIIIILSINFSNSQSFEDIKCIDTLYIIFKGKKYEKKEERIINDTLTTKRFSFYHHNVSNEFPKITFLFPKIISGGGFLVETQLVDKSFIKKHKDKIIDFHFFRNDDDLSESNFYNDSKTKFYIIDLSKNSNQMTIYLVSPIIMQRRIYPE